LNTNVSPGAHTSAIARYMGMVAPIAEETWFTVHHRVFIPGRADPSFPGNAHKTLTTAMNDAKYWASRGHCVYLSQGMYRNPAAPKASVSGKVSPYPIADRTYQNLVACKNLYFDVDVKKDGYASTAEVAAAVTGFISWSKLPPPTVIVGSGSGGWHIYWTLDTAVERGEFANMAGRLINAGVEYGLLFDRQCTRDATRLLRVAGTWNFKYANDDTPATAVTLDYCGKEHIPVGLMAKGLARWPATVPHEGKPGGAGAHAGTGGVDAHGLSLDENADLTGGMKREFAPADIDEVAKYCPFIKNTLDAGGANLVGDSQWHTVVALSCHCVEPRKTAHRLCEKSQYYSEAGTDEKLAACQLAREQRETIGPPKCAHIAIEREECKTCPYLQLETTPLSVGFKINPAGNASGKGAPPVGGRILTSALPPQVLWDTPGNRANIMWAIDQRLAADPYTFQNGNRLVSLRVSPGVDVLFPNLVDRSPTEKGVTTPAVRDEGDMPAILETSEADVRLIADQDHWMGVSQGRPAKDGDGGTPPKHKRTHVPADTCTLYIKSSRSRIGFRPLLGLARVPIIDRLGNLNYDTGYDEATGVFRDRTPTLNVPDQPTRADCGAALETLLMPFMEYKFEEKNLGCGLILSTLFTAIERPFIALSPMIGINAASGVGKGKLLRSTSMLAFDTDPRFMTYGFNTEEFEKRLGTMLRIPGPFLVIDNANNKTISNDTLENIITEGEVTIRTLGSNDKYAHVVSRALIAACGVGIQFSGDMTRRVLVLNPIPSGASPETQVFRLDPPAYVKEHRIELLSAAFTLMRAFRQAGCPKLAKTAAGSFPDWEWRVRDLVMWLTGIDATTQFTKNADVASDKQATAVLLKALHGVFGSNPFYAKDVQSIYDILAAQKRQGNGIIPVASNRVAAHTAEIELFEALEEKFAYKPPNTTSIGNWARGVENTHVEGLKLTRRDVRGNRTELRILLAS
jgi:hypothetical protein